MKVLLDVMAEVVPVAGVLMEVPAVEVVLVEEKGDGVLAGFL